MNREDIEKVIPELDFKTSNIMELLNNVLYWAEGQMDSTDVKIKAVSLPALVIEVEGELKERLAEKSITLEYDFDKDEEIKSNEGFLRVILRNLIVNAIKFSHAESKIRLELSDNDEMKTISVIDSGVGMSQQQVQQLFSDEIINTVGTKGERGSGIGLTLTSDFISKLGGKLNVESEEGKGSTFSVTLPMTAPQDAQ